MLKNAYLLAKIGADTAENGQHFAAILPIGPRGSPMETDDEMLAAALEERLVSEIEIDLFFSFERWYQIGLRTEIGIASRD